MTETINPVELRLFFENRQHFGVVKIIDYLLSEEGRDLLQIGSGTIDLLAIPGEPTSSRPKEWRNMSIGIPGKETPLESLSNVMRHTEVLGDEALFVLDRICHEWAEIIASIATAIPFEDIPDEA